MAKQSHVNQHIGQAKRQVLEELLNFSSENSDDELSVPSVQLQVTTQCKPGQSNGKTTKIENDKENMQQESKAKRKLFRCTEGESRGISSKVPVPEIEYSQDQNTESNAGSNTDAKGPVSLCSNESSHKEVPKISAIVAKFKAPIPGDESSKLKVLTKSSVVDKKSNFTAPGSKASEHKGATKTCTTEAKNKASDRDTVKQKKIAGKKTACSKPLPKVKRSALGNVTLADLGISFDFSESSDEGEANPCKRNIELVCLKKKLEPGQVEEEVASQENKQDPVGLESRDVGPRKKQAPTTSDQSQTDMMITEGGKFKTEKQSTKPLCVTTPLLHGTGNPEQNVHPTVQPSTGIIKKTDALRVKTSVPSAKNPHPANLLRKATENRALQYHPNVSVIRSAHQSSKLLVDSSPSEDSLLPLSESTRLDCPESDTRPKQHFDLHLAYQNSPDLFDTNDSSLGLSQQSSFEQLNIEVKKRAPSVQTRIDCDDNVERKESSVKDKLQCSGRSLEVSESDSEYQSCLSTTGVSSDSYETVDVSIQTSFHGGDAASPSCVEQKSPACSLQDTMYKNNCHISQGPIAHADSDNDDTLFHCEKTDLEMHEKKAKPQNSKAHAIDSDISVKADLESRCMEIENCNQNPQQKLGTKSSLSSCKQMTEEEKESTPYQTPTKTAEDSPLFLSPFNEQQAHSEDHHAQGSPPVFSTSFQEQKARCSPGGKVMNKALTTGDTSRSPGSEDGCQKKLDLLPEAGERGSGNEKDVCELRGETDSAWTTDKVVKPATCLRDTSTALGNDTSRNPHRKISKDDSSSDDDDQLEAFFQRLHPPPIPASDADEDAGRLSDFIVSDSDVTDSDEDVCYADLSGRLDNKDLLLPELGLRGKRLGREPQRQFAASSSNSSSNEWLEDSDDDSCDGDDGDSLGKTEATPLSKTRPTFSQSQTPREASPKWYTPATSLKTKPRRDKVSDKQFSALPATAQSKGDNSDVWATPAPLASRGSSRVTSKSYSFLCSLSTDCPEQLRDGEARSYIVQFKKRQQELSARLFKLFNFTVFENQLPPDLPVVWNKRLLKTAGLCKQKRVGSRYTAMIELSNKVCDTAERVRDTLVHEMCHAAVWTLNQAKEGHGPHWKYWARKANRAHPEIPVIRRCHDYSISTKYVYKCIKCGYQIGRHSKSLDTEKKVCGHCRGRFVLQTTNKGSLSSSSASLSATPRTPNPFALFVKENYGVVKKRHGGLPHKEVMEALSKEFAKAKIAE